MALFLVLPFVILFIALSQKSKNRKLNKSVVSMWSKILCFVCGLKLKSTGVKHKNPVLVVANHISWLDIPAIHSYKMAGFVAKKEISN
ncbi:MAG: hypothetical protein JKX98_05275 [Alcanivoracaceae bacterium]|nr:hypothetical protein [Alcanivoracaceae bacterium]